ncbi:FmdB family zinc ribbon protein [Nocardioides convexus]|uniref:FmdB family zinc ribbon protein n=1 Tax=Nocardioides convexus TaxID=2712224 RepID=UPI002418155E|nr:FmdB family zinc ribbon protein [Nocardioides convexus]
MPTYQYLCTACGHAFEQFQSLQRRRAHGLPGVRRAAAQGLQLGRRGLQGIRLLQDRQPLLQARPARPAAAGRPPRRPPRRRPRGSSDTSSTPAKSSSTGSSSRLLQQAPPAGSSSSGAAASSA